MLLRGVAMNGFLWLVVGVASAIVMMAASRLALRHAIQAAHMLRLPPFLVGFTLMAIGTDIPELVNSIASSTLGKGDIALGDSVGSVFTQGTLILGIFPFLVRKTGALAMSRRNVLLLSALTLAALGLSALAVVDGVVTRGEGVALVAAWCIATLIAWRARVASPRPDDARADVSRGGRVRSLAVAGGHVAVALFGLALVGGAATGLVRAVTELSSGLGVPEYVLSFFGASLGTSMPELAFEATALRRGEKDLALGDLLGSCLIDASLAMGVGPVVAPIVVSARLNLDGTAIAAAGMILVAVLVGMRARLDKIAGALLIAAYAAAYVFLLAGRS